MNTINAAWDCTSTPLASRLGLTTWPIVDALQAARLVKLDEEALQRLRHASAVSLGHSVAMDGEAEGTALAGVFALDLTLWIGCALVLYLVVACVATLFCAHQLCTCRRQCPKVHAKCMRCVGLLFRGMDGEADAEEAGSGWSTRTSSTSSVDFDASQIGEHEEFTPMQRAKPLLVWIVAGELFFTWHI